MSALAWMLAAATLPGPDALVRELRAGQHPGVTGFELVVDGQRLASFAAPELARRAPDLRSATKSITALLVGIALERGELRSLQTRMAELLPRHRAVLERDPRKAAMTLADLLSMRSGLDCDDWDERSPGHEDKMYEQRDWVAFWAAQPMRASPGERFSYCTGNVLALGQALAHATGQPVDRYAQAHLFGPLGLADVRWQHWDKGREVDTGGHLRLRPDALLRIGQLALARGTHEGRQIVPASWIDAVSEVRTSIPGRTQSYGYLWWLDRTTLPGLPATRLVFALGNGGNLLIVMPELRAVAVFTGTRFNRPDALEPLHWLRDRLLPGLRAGTETERE